MTADLPPAIELKDVVKTYGATRALDGASFSVRGGAVHALLGENGAGKSTMIKLLSGTIQPNEGTISVFGESIIMREPRDAHRHGLQTAFQELTLVPDLTVLQNMLLSYQPTSIGWQLRHRSARRQVTDYFERIGLGSIDVRKDARSYGLALRQKIEIARAIFRDPRILFLDEATSALTGSDIDWLAGLVDQVKARGVTVVFITHRMAEVRRFCDAVTVLRNGRDVGSFQVDAIEDKQLIELIVGRSLAAAYPPKRTLPASAKPLLTASHLATARRLVDCSFELRKGEILGVSALQGMGQRDLFMALFGAMAVTHGGLTLEGQPIKLGSPAHAIRLGFGLVPEERKTEGLFLKLSGRENVLMPALDRFSRAGVIDAGSATLSAGSVMARVQVNRRALFTRAGAFSGGNHQKLVLAKWLVTQTRVLLLFDPTRGVDVGTKREIYLLIRAYVEAGGAVLFHSTEIPELVNLCDRVLVMYGGRIAQEFGADGSTIDERSIMAAALGQTQSARSPEAAPLPQIEPVR
jgi:ribose transport system ATP-binding protein